MFYERPLAKLDRILAAHLHAWPDGWRSARTALPMWARHRLGMARHICRHLDGYTGRISAVPHHAAHAASPMVLVDHSPLDDIVTVHDDGSVRLHLECFDFHRGAPMTTPLFHQLLGGPPRAAEGPIAQRHMDLSGWSGSSTAATT